MSDMLQPKPRFTGLFIPVEILEMEGLTSTDMMLLSWIDALQNKEKGGCFASNAWFVKKMGLKENTIKILISKLVDKGLIRRASFDGRERILVTCKKKWYGEEKKEEPEQSGSTSEGDYNQPKGLNIINPCGLPESTPHIYIEKSLEKSIETHPLPPKGESSASAPMCSVSSASSKKAKISKPPAEIDPNVKAVAEKLADIAKKANPTCRPHMATYYDYVSKLMIDEKQEEKDILRAWQYACNDMTISADGLWNGWSPSVTTNKGIIKFHERFQRISQQSKCQKDRKFAPCLDAERAQETIDAANARAIT